MIIFDDNTTIHTIQAQTNKCIWPWNWWEKKIKLTSKYTHIRIDQTLYIHIYHIRHIIHNHFKQYHSVESTSLVNGNRNSYAMVCSVYMCMCWSFVNTTNIRMLWRITNLIWCTSVYRILAFNVMCCLHKVTLSVSYSSAWTLDTSFRIKNDTPAFDHSIQKS